MHCFFLNPIYVFSSPRQVRAGHGAWHPRPHSTHWAFCLWQLLWRRLQVILKSNRLSLNLDLILDLGTRGTLCSQRCSHKTATISTATTRSTMLTRFVILVMFISSQLFKSALPMLLSSSLPWQKKSGSVRRHMTSYLSHEVKILNVMKKEEMSPGEHVHNRSFDAGLRRSRLPPNSSLHRRSLCQGELEVSKLTWLCRLGGT